MLVSFDSTSTSVKDKEDLKKVFKDNFKELYNDDGRAYYISKEVFSHKEDNLNFNYQYAIGVLETADNDVLCHIELFMVPTFDSLCEKRKENLKESIGYNYEPEMMDVVMDGYTVRMGYESVELEEYEYDPMESEEVATLVYSAGAIYKAVDSLRGFFLDRPWNRMGTTGWDSIKEYVQGEDAIQLTINRYEESRS